METQEGRMSSFAASIDCITKSLESKSLSDDALIKSCQQASEAVTSQWMINIGSSMSDESTTSKFKFTFFSKQLEEVTISLWNVTVARQTNKDLEERICATLRQLCYDIICCPLCAYDGDNSNTRNLTYLHRRITMAIKTGKSWLAVNEWQRALNVLLTGKEDIENITSTSESQQDAEIMRAKDIVNLNKNYNKTLCFLAESGVGLNDNESAFKYMELAANQTYLETGNKHFKEFTVEISQLASQSYNFGLNAGKKHGHDVAIKWLNYSYKIGQKMVKKNDKMAAQTLRLLAHVYCEQNTTDDVTKALHAVELANKYESHPLGIHLRLKILTKDMSVNEDEIKKVLLDLLRHPELNIDIGLSACQYLNTTGRYESCELGLKELLSRFAGSRHVGKVHAQRLQSSIQRLPSQDAVEYTDQFLDDTEILKELDEESKNNLQVLLWEEGGKSLKDENLERCLSWYNYSMRLFVFGKSLDEIKTNEETAANIGRLHRNRALCLLKLGRYEQAEEAANSALEMSKNSAFSYFTAFKVAIIQGQEKKAIKAIDDLMTSSTLESGSTSSPSDEIEETRLAMVSEATQFAFERNQRNVAMATLRHLALSGNNDQAKLTAYRCLIRLYLSMADESENVTSEKSQQDDVMEISEEGNPHSNATKEGYMKKAADGVTEATKLLQKLKHKIDCEVIPEAGDVIPLPGKEHLTITQEQLDIEVTWFMKIAWNMALQYPKDPFKMKRLFYSYKDLLELHSPNESILLRQKTGLLMCAASGLSVAKNLKKTLEMRLELQQVLNIVTLYHDVCSRLLLFQTDQNPPENDKGVLLIGFYQFEALAKLTPSSGNKIPADLERIFVNFQKLSFSDSKTFETIADLCMDLPAQHSGLCKLAIKLAIEKLKTGDKGEEMIKKRGDLHRKLIETSLKEATTTNPTTLEESWTYLNEFYQQHNIYKFSEVDCLWFTIECWNVGVRLFASNHVIEAEKWCALALRLLANLETYRSNYESHMNRAYQEILSKKDIAQSREGNLV